MQESELIEKLEKDLLDKLAILENAQWHTWSFEISQSEKISKPRMERWQKLWLTKWEDFTPAQKDQDREYAYYALKIFQDYIPTILAHLKEKHGLVEKKKVLELISKHKKDEDYGLVQLIKDVEGL